MRNISEMKALSLSYVTSLASTLRRRIDTLLLKCMIQRCLDFGSLKFPNRYYALFYSKKSVIGPAIPEPIQLFGFLGPGMTGMEGVTSNGSTYPSWTGPRADWRAILSSLINARVMDSVGFKPACSCWRHNRQDTTTLATLDTITMLQLATLSLVLRGLFLSFLLLLSLS